MHLVEKSRKQSTYRFERILEKVIADQAKISYSSNSIDHPTKIHNIISTSAEVTRVTIHNEHRDKYQI